MSEEKLNELHLFAGAGGGILAGQLRGNRCVCAVELDPYAQAVLVARQNDGTFPPFPIWDDVRTFDGRRWRGIVDAVAGGFPCQDVSAAGTGDGLDGERSGLWTEMARIVREIRPKRVEVENSPMLTSRGLGRVLGDLAAMGFDVEWGVLSAADTGAPHLRERIWILAHSNRAWESQHAGREQIVGLGLVERGKALAYAEREGLEGGAWEGLHGAWRPTEQFACGSQDVADSVCEREQRLIASGVDTEERQRPIERPDRPRSYGFGRWPTEPAMGRVVDGMAHRAHRIRALGNGQVPRVDAAAFTLLDNTR